MRYEERGPESTDRIFLGKHVDNSAAEYRRVITADRKAVGKRTPK